MPKARKEKFKEGREKFKTRHDVFDEFTNRTIFKLITEGHFRGLESPINIGKESNVFSALNKEGNRVIVKIYRLEPLKLMNGAMETLRELKKNNLKLAIISGSMNILLEKFIPNYNEIFDDVFVSKIYFDEQGFINKIEPTEFDMDKKADALSQIAQRENIELKECVFVGDYLNDLKAMQESGLGIAFNCKEEKLKAIADVVIEKKDLREILRYVLN